MSIESNNPSKLPETKPPQAAIPTPTTEPIPSSIIAQTIANVFSLQKKRLTKGLTPTLQKLEEWKKINSQIKALEGQAIPQELQGQLATAKQIVQSALTSSSLALEAKKLLQKAESTMKSIEGLISQMKDSMSPEDLERERGRRFMHLLGMLLDFKDRILSLDPKEVESTPELRDALIHINHLVDQMVLSNREQVNAFHGLNLEQSKKTTFKPLFTQDLASTKAQEAVRASRLEDSYKRSMQETYSHHHYIPLDATVFRFSQAENILSQVRAPATTIKTTNSSKCEDVYKKVEATIRDFSSRVVYNSFHTLINFIDFFEKVKKGKPEITPIEAYRLFDPTPNLVREHGDICAGKSLAILEVIQKEHDIRGYPIVEKSGLTAIPMHVAAVIPCEDGVILIEILNIKNPILAIKYDQATKMKINEKAEITFEIRSEKDGRSVLYTSNAERQEDGVIRYSKSEFPLTVLPIKAVILKYLVDRVEFPLIKEGCPYGIIVNVHDEEIIFKVGEGRDAKRTIIPFSKFESKEVEKLLDEFSKALGVSKEFVKAQIVKIIEHRAILENLQKQARVPIPTYKKS